MKPLPFSVSAAAGGWILEGLRMAENDPDLVGLVPVLTYCLKETGTDEVGKIIELCPDPFFSLGWDSAENVTAWGCLELEIMGRKLWLSPSCLEELEGKRLILETVEVGFPTPSDKKREVLRAVPEES